MAVLPLLSGRLVRADGCDMALVTGVRPSSGCICRAAAADGLAAAVGALARLVAAGRPPRRPGRAAPAVAAAGGRAGGGRQREALGSGPSQGRSNGSPVWLTSMKAGARWRLASSCPTAWRSPRLLRSQQMDRGCGSLQCGPSREDRPTARSSLNRSGGLQSELLMRLGFAPFRVQIPESPQITGPLPQTSGRGPHPLHGPQAPARPRQRHAVLRGGSEQPHVWRARR